MAKCNATPEIDFQLLRNVIGPQLQMETRTEINLDGINYEIDYCIIDDFQPSVPAKKVFVLVTGFGSGWRGIAMLGAYLAKYGHIVCMPSLPGYGNSSDPSPEYYGTIGFYWESIALEKFVEKVFPNTRVHFVAHSMGARIIARLACNRPDLVETLTMLAPAGFENRNPWELSIKFAISALMHTIAFAFSDDALWQKLEEFLPKEKSPRTKQRIPQRVSEWHRLCKKVDAKKILEMLPERISLNCIWGNMDVVCPMEKSGLAILDMSKRFVAKSCLHLFHNMTMYASHRTAEAIDAFICDHDKLAR